MTDFCHLHVHTTYSQLDGLCAPKALVTRCHELGMSACAITDHEHVGGLIKFYRACKDAGVKPILGMEATIGDHHLVLLARNLDGYRGLMATASRGRRLKMSDIVPTGLIALTACARGHVLSAVRDRDMDRALATLRRLKQIFDAVYVELQFNGPHHAPHNPQLCQLARDAGVGIVATNDVHYLTPDDHEAQNVLMAIRQGTRDGFRHPAPEFYLKSGQEMRDACVGFDLALSNTLEVAERCTVELELDKPDLPRFSDDEDRELSRLARRGFMDKTLSPGVPAQRLHHELAVIQNMGYSGYYLIVQDFVNWARAHDVAVGPGRGSGPGSLVAYVLGITDLDPLEHGLFFERFLNPERVSMPDFDIDFAQDGRQRVIDYVRGRWGNVAQIATYMTLQPKSTIKDVARILGLPFDEVNEYTRVIPGALRPKTGREKAMTPFDLALSKAPELCARAKSDEAYARVLGIARQLMGCVRQTGKHAGGVVIGRLPLSHYTPLTEDGLTAYDMKDVEAVGLVKFDFLGVKTLDVIQGTGVTVPETLDDPAVYDLIASGRTWGMFQVETPGMTRLCVDMRPDCFNDIVAAVALYRPGPKESGMVDDYIWRKHGVRRVVYPHARLKDVLSYTYGTIVYQEQVMQTAQILAGYTLGGADLLRRAMGKKIQKEMDAQHDVFIQGCVDNGVDEKLAIELFSAIDKHAAYSFNKAHAAAYAMITYQTAWLRLHHPLAFAASLFTVEGGVQKVLARYVREARADDILVLGPDVNASSDRFTVEDGAVRWGLGSIKGLGQVESLVAGQPYSDLFDLARRSGLNRRGLEALICAGAVDGDRATLMSAVAMAVSDGKAARLDEVRGQTSMFDIDPDPDDVEPWSRLTACEREFAVLGNYVTDHPSAVHGHRVIVDVFARLSAAGRMWARVTLENEEGHENVIFFPDAYEQYFPLLTVGEPLTVDGRENEEGDLIVDDCRRPDVCDS